MIVWFWQVIDSLDLANFLFILNWIDYLPADTSRMSREVHVHFWEGVEVRFLLDYVLFLTC